MKKNRKKKFYINYRKLNAITKKDSYLLLQVDKLLDSFIGAIYFSTLDLMSRYWQVIMHPADREKTAFITKYGTYKFNIILFELCNTLVTF